MKHPRIAALAVLAGTVGFTGAASAKAGPPTPYCGPGHEGGFAWITKAYDGYDQWLATFITDTQAEGQAECAAFIASYSENN
jgi:hypothetical protein